MYGLMHNNIIIGLKIYFLLINRIHEPTQDIFSSIIVFQRSGSSSILRLKESGALQVENSSK